jgi:soluble lytic murein transglycosylase-like protein
VSAFKTAFGPIGALCAALAVTAMAEDVALPNGAPAPVARPADLDEAAAKAPEGAPNPAAGGAAEVAPIKDQAGESAAADPAQTRQRFRALLRREAGQTGLPFDIADAVAAIESGYDPAAIGAVGEIGLMQVRPETAAMLGFRGDAAELAKPEVNIHYGVAYLAEAWRLANGDVCRALMKYRAGHNEEQMSALSAAYCGRARTHLAAIGSPLAAQIFVPAIAGPGPVARPVALGSLLPKLPPTPRGAPPIRTEATSRAFWAAQEARAAALRKRVEAKWRKMASR